MTDEAASDAIERIENRLMSHGVYVESIDPTGSALRIEYETVAPGEGVPHQQIGSVVNVFREHVGEGWTITDIEATVTDPDGTTRGRWRMDADWLEELEAGELTEVEFSERVLETVDESIDRGEPAE